MVKRKDSKEVSYLKYTSMENPRLLCNCMNTAWKEKRGLESPFLRLKYGLFDVAYPMREQISLVAAAISPSNFFII